MDDGDLTGVDDGFAIEAHQVDVLDVLAEAVHVLQVGEDGVEALHACGAGGNDHLLAGTHQLDAGAGDVGLQVLGVVAAGQCDAEQALIALADLQSVHDAAGRLQSSDDEDFALGTAIGLLVLGDGSSHAVDILSVLGLGDADGIAAAGHTGADVFPPVGGVQTVDADDPLGAAVIHGLQGVVQAEAGDVLLVLGHSVLEVQHQGVSLIDVGVFDQTGLLRIQEHHRAAQALLVRIIHRMAPPQGRSSYWSTER